MASIKHLFHINASKEKVFEAISTIEGLKNWWTVQTAGSPEVGGIIEFRFGEFENDMKVLELKPNESLTWECVASAPDWVGTKFTFHVDTNEGKTRLRFEQSGWKETGDFYAACCFSWGRYMESLRQFCQTGKGEAFGSEGYRK